MSEIISPPTDSISSIQFSPSNPNHLLTSAWDSTVRYYDVETNEQKAKFDHRAAVLSARFSADGSKAYSAGLDCAVKELDFGSGTARVLGQHDDAVSCLSYYADKNTVITASWERTLRVWDPRVSSYQPVSISQLDERAYYMDSASNYIVVALASRQFNIFDPRMVKEPVQRRESSLKYMTRSVACMADGTGYANGSVEGRIAVEYFSASQEDKKYAFKCHRQTIDDVDHVWPVNALAFHPIYNTFASGGSDGTVSVWDHEVKKRLKQYPKFTSPVAALAFSPDGSKLAVATGYTWDEGTDGLDGAEPPKIMIKKVGDEVKPKGRN